MSRGSLQFYQRMPAPLITITTDFGVEDHYVGTMKGVILTRCPDARLVDITHQIPAFSLVSAAYTIAQTAPYFPPATVHLIVVDPGVGSSRRALLAEAHGQLFIAPDNGCLTLVLHNHPQAQIRQLSNPALWLPDPSSTFHGRDLFAPAAGYLAAGTVLPDHVGPLVRDPVLLPNLQATQLSPNSWSGLVLSTDHFGNVITNFPAASLKPSVSSGFSLEGARSPVSELRSTFAGAPPGLAFAYWGSSGFLEIGVNQNSAAASLDLRPGTPLLLKLPA